MEYFYCSVITIAAYFTLQAVENKKLKKIFIGIYVAIGLMVAAYFFGEQFGNAFYFLKH